MARARAGLAEAFGTAAKPNVELAPTAAAFAAGDISVGHAGVVVRTVEAVRDIADVDEVTRGEGQALLLATAVEVDPAQLGRAGLRLRHRLDPDAAERLARDEDAQEERRDGYLVQEASGMWVLHGVLPALAGATLKAALDPLAAPRPAHDGTPDPRTGGMRFADAVTALAELSLTARGPDRGQLPSRGGAPTRLVLTAELATLQAATHPQRVWHRPVPSGEHWSGRVGRVGPAAGVRPGSRVAGRSARCRWMCCRVRLRWSRC